MTPAPLGSLLDGCPPALAGRPIADLALDSREVIPGALFCALAGTRGHGLDHLEEAIARGAAVVAWEPAPGVEPPAQGVTAVRVPGLRGRVGEIADRFFGAPSARLKIAAVTGTNGKTSVAWLVAGALDRLGMPAGYVGTLGHGRLPAPQSSRLTTPDCITLHRWLADLAAAGVEACAVEASSHALDQDRLAAVRIAVAGFTNLSPEHLDYHGTMEAYAAAKRRLFAWPDLGLAVLNADDAWSATMTAPDVPVLWVGTGDGVRDLAARHIRGAVESRAGRLAVEFDGAFGRGRIDSRLAGAFNASNLLVALGMLAALGVPVDAAAAALSATEAPPGRMQAIGGEGEPLVVVDFAHTPAALERVLEALRDGSPGRLHLVFGAGGERDRAKRPLMGEIAARLADRVWLTDDNPRGEDPDRIVAEILAGVPAAADVRVERDRATAIRQAVGESGPGDVVLVAGKGHEATQVTAEGARPFSDAAVVAEALAARREARR